VRDRLLIVDDDLAVRKQIRWALNDTFEVEEASSVDECLASLTEFSPAVVTLDLRLSSPTCRAGLELLQRMIARDPLVKVIMVTADVTDGSATSALDHGAWDYYTKPIVNEELKLIVSRAAHVRRLQSAAAKGTRGAVTDPLDFAEWLGASPAARRVARLLEALAPGPEPVLLVGEPGTRRDLAAGALHAASRRSGPFRAWSCVKGLPPSAELPMHGTLYLEGIHDLDEASQARLPDWIAEHEATCRVVVAAFDDLTQLVAGGRFSHRTYHFLAALTVTLPPLRERPTDIPLLAERLASAISRRFGVCPRPFHPDALAALSGWAWPGNLRELERRILTALVCSEGEAIVTEDLWAPLDRAGAGSLRENLAELERTLVGKALAGAKGNITQAARELGVSRPTLHALVRKHGLDPHVFRRGSHP